MLEQFKVQLTEHRCVSPELLEDIGRLKAQHWHYSISQQLQWMRENLASGDYHLIIHGQDNDVVAYMDMVECDARVDGEKIALTGIGNVCVDTRLQNQKLGYLLMDVCLFYLRQLERTGVLLCREKLTGFYTKAKWVPFNKTVSLMGAPYTDRLFFSSDRFTHAKEVQLFKNF